MIGLRSSMQTVEQWPLPRVLAHLRMLVLSWMLMVSMRKMFSHFLTVWLLTISKSVFRLLVAKASVLASLCRVWLTVFRPTSIRCSSFAISGRMIAMLRSILTGQSSVMQKLLWNSCWSRVVSLLAKRCRFRWPISNRTVVLSMSRVWMLLATRSWKPMVPLTWFVPLRIVLIRNSRIRYSNANKSVYPVCATTG